MTEVLLAERLDVLQEAAEISASERREGDHERSRFRAGLNEPEFGIASPEGILRLHRRDRVHAMGAPERVGRNLAEADRADRSGLDMPREFATVSSIGTPLSTRCT